MKELRIHPIKASSFEEKHTDLETLLQCPSGDQVDGAPNQPSPSKQMSFYPFFILGIQATFYRKSMLPAMGATK